MDPTPILSVHGLSKRFVIHERDERIHAFSDLSFDAFSGQLVCLVGASGSGKSSVLKCIHRTYVPTLGQILYQSSAGDRVDLATVNDSQVLRLRRTEIRLVSQFLQVLPRRSARQVIEHALHEAADFANRATEPAESFLEQVGLPRKLWNLPPNTFSGGERQLVNLARALAVQPRLLLLDEPTASLDPASTDLMLERIEQLKQRGIAMIAVFHNPQIVSRLADCTVQMSGGLCNHPIQGTLA